MHYSKNVRIGGGAHEVPMETVPRMVNIGGEPHILAYINRAEAAQLHRQGGGVMKGGGQLKGPGGVPAYDDNGDGGDGGDKGDNEGGVQNDTGNASFGGKDGVETSSVSADAYGGGGSGLEKSAYGIEAVETGGPYGSLYDTRASDVFGRAGSPSTGASEGGYFGGEANYGGGEGVRGGSGGTEGNQPYYAPPPTAPAAPAAPKGPTPEEIAAENARIRKKSEDDAEALVRKAFADKFTDPYYAERKSAYLTSQDPEIAAARGKAMDDLIGALAPQGLAATPLANRQAAGLGTAATSEEARLGTVGDQEVADYTGRVGKGLTGEIARVRGAADPMAAYTSGTPGAIGTIDTDILNRPLADFLVNLGYTPEQAAGLAVNPPQSLVEALRQRGGIQLYEPASSGRVGGGA